MTRLFGVALGALLIWSAPSHAQIYNPPAAGATVDTSTLATKAEVQAAAAAAANAVKTVNGVTPTAGAVTIPIPTAASTAPPSVADSSAIGNMTTQYALANHTHASKSRKIRVQTAADGSVTWTYATPFTTGVVPLCIAVAEVAAGVTDVVNVQIVDIPTATSVKFLVNRTQRSVVALIGLTVLSIPASPGATWVHAICLEP